MADRTQNAEQAPQATEYIRVCAERNFYRRLLELGQQSVLAPLLKEALALIVELAGAQKGYLELQDDDAADVPSWWMAHGFADGEISTVRSHISRGIIAQALATGQTVVTPSALLDPRFKERDSVRLAKIEAVLCTPIGHDPPRGVLYLQGRAASGLFSEEEQARAEVFARHFAPVVDRLLAQERDDPTRPLRQRLRLDGIIGHSPALAEVLHQAALAAPLKVDVLLTGETGTGKTRLARVIHDNSPRAGQQFVELNCAALPDALVESELFGAVKGAATDVRDDRPGKVAAAERGTLFLDEIGEMPMAAQTKLLQFIQSKVFYPLGSNKPVRADIRLIAATNQDLTRAIAEKRFREDLYYRLNVLPIRVPSLAERREDIPDLVTFFIANACERHGLPRLGLSRNALRAVESAEWPGNLNQLLHAIEAAVIRAAGEAATQIEPPHVFPQRSQSVAAAPEAFTFQEATRDFQTKLLRSALDETDWNISETARRLDLTRSHVYNLIRAFALQREQP